MTSDDIHKSLAYIHALSWRGNHCGFGELSVGTGGKADRRIDFWAIDCWPSSGHKKTAYEIKVSRQDFKNELKNPEKRVKALRWSNYFYFATPLGLIKPDELPPECGLVEFSEEWTQTQFAPLREHWPEGLVFPTWTVRAPERDAFPPSWNFVAAVCRRAASEQAEFNRLRDENKKLAEELCDLRERVA